jgi:hypothetical protein
MGPRKNTKNSTIEATMLLEIQGRCWNEAKKYLKKKELSENCARKAENLLKTHHIASLEAVDSECFAREVTAIRPEKAQERHVLRRSRALDEARKATRSRLRARAFRRFGPEGQHYTFQCGESQMP